MLNPINLSPQYVFGAFCSRAASFKTYDQKTKQDICLLASISSFIKSMGSECFAAPDTILSVYNANCNKFDLKPIKRSTLFTIQSRLLFTGYIERTSLFDGHKGRKFRRFSINTSMIQSSFPSVFNLAFKRASAFINRVLDSNQKKKDRKEKQSKNIKLGNNANNNNWTIRTKNKSKDLSKNKKERTKTPNGAFFKSRFKSDCDLAYKLQNAARNGSISAGGAKKLISLFKKHGVYMSPVFLKFLQYRIFNFAIKRY
ncbi:hypothetical protein ACWU37_21035 (plasmid) [Photobacterium damselae subsp. damselae]